MSDEAIGYDAGHIKVLEWPEAVRRRPGMYIGSTGERGLRQLILEVADQAVNEAVSGRAGAVGVTLLADGGVRVTDDGPGIPFAAAGDTEGPGLEALLTQLSFGARPGDRRAVPLTLFGLGPAVANALSSRLTAEVRRAGVRWVQEYARGVAVTRPTAAGPATRSGTTLTCRPDAGIFGTTECSFAVLAERFRELAFLNRGLDISLTDERPADGAQTARFRFLGGVRDFVVSLPARAGTPVHTDVIGFEREDPRMAGTMEVALRWCGSPEERIRGFANSVATPHGGTHEAGLREGVAAALDAYARGRGLLTADAPGLDAGRVAEGLTAVVSVKLDDPRFVGATHGELGGAAVRACVAEAVEEHLGAWLEEHPEQATAVVGRILGTDILC
ncbi:ATP-binding protein [Streptomyces virginiae]|uniref:ATP-binding protein n=1 Tax=Streptomyces virginiae TaxID=1961 RepID=UPI002254B330|nr:ATP-binding protein [Streptomyces virginiae]MCX4718450.1 ATP-binding protein [Streptomyces virginiae]